ncbi:MAG: N-acetyl-gamma-glutamyl-phosphate reductase [Bacteroidetes bacterium]|nr:N-acetyl-gamma-glutamyl-phosphate reductase [Bacteroidota bacterium]
MKRIKVGIVGAAGYTGGELIRLLLNHPLAEIVYAHSRQFAGRYVSDIHTDLLGDTPLTFHHRMDLDVDVVFLCVSHGEAKKIMTEEKIPASARIIDMSQDHRVAGSGSKPFVYGLPELNGGLISKAFYVANPGCFATAIQLGLLPLATEKIIQGPVQINCTTGSTGAGRELTESSHFSWRQNNLSVYKAFTHQHLSEIRQSLEQLMDGTSPELTMVPQRGSFTRGIMAVQVLKCEWKVSELMDLYERYYMKHPFVKLSRSAIDLKQVVNTNKCILYIEKAGDQLMVISIIDNLLKGASGQALQNMNIMFGLEETSGLKLKASVF